MPNIKILESIHHGEFRAKRVMEVYGLTTATVTGLLASSAYGYVNVTPRWVDEVLTNLREQGAAQYSWSNFEVLTDEHDAPQPKSFGPEAVQYASYEVLFLLHRGGATYRTVANHWARDAEDAVRLAEESTKHDCAYSWDQCQLVAVVPLSIAANWNRDERDRVWEAAE